VTRRATLDAAHCGRPQISMHRKLGSTGLTVTRVGLGLAALGRPGYINLGRDADLGVDRSVEAMERRCHAMLDSAYAAGVRYFDAARSYGFAEKFLASWLTTRSVPADAVTVGSKWGYSYIGAWRLDAPTHEIKDLSVDALRRQFLESRAVLGDRLRLYQVHSATLESGILDDRQVLDELLRLRSEGLVVGLTVSGPHQKDTIDRALDVEIGGVNPFECVQATWNLLEPSAGAALARAHAQGWGVIVKEVLANGRLTDEHAGPGLKALEPLARSAGALDAIAFAAALANPWADVVLSGAVTERQFSSNLRALEITWNPTTPPVVAQSPDQYWAARSKLSWA
jgi:aryl-alcohol dehydrogenase-like predicted oxidoreductase